MNDANSAVTNLDKAYDMAKTYKAVLGSSTGKPG